ncbi:MAG: hypothetical protein JWN37_428 [Candidatus Nomurabacteria bacterium]|nr:hypothetical protein [Candidatus Nomurabacteria bacterium]
MKKGIKKCGAKVWVIFFTFILISSFSANSSVHAAESKILNFPVYPLQSVIRFISFKTFSLYSVSSHAYALAHNLPQFAPTKLSAIPSIKTDELSPLLNIGNSASQNTVILSDAVNELGCELVKFIRINLCAGESNFVTPKLAMNKVDNNDLVIDSAIPRQIAIVGEELHSPLIESIKNFALNLNTATVPKQQPYEEIQNDIPDLKFNFPRLAEFSLLPFKQYSSFATGDNKASAQGISVPVKKSTLPFLDRLSLSVFCKIKSLSGVVDENRCSYDSLAGNFLINNLANLNDGNTQPSTLNSSGATSTSTGSSNTPQDTFTNSGNISKPVYITQYLTKYITLAGSPGPKGPSGVDGKDGLDGMSGQNGANSQGGFGGFINPSSSYVAPTPYVAQSLVGISTIGYLRDTTIEYAKFNYGTANNLSLISPTVDNGVFNGTNIFNGGVRFNDNVDINILTATSSNFLNSSTTNSFANNFSAVNSILGDAIITNANVTNSTTTNQSTTNLNLTNGTTSNQFINNLAVINSTTTNASTTNSYISNLLNDNSTTTNLVVTNASTTNATTTNSFISKLWSTLANITDLIIGNATTTNLFAANATSTNFFSTLARITGLTVDNSVTTNATTTNGYISNLTNDNGNIGNLVVTNASTTNGTTTNSYIANLANTNAVITNATTTNSFIARLWSTLGDITGLNTVNLTATNATSTNFFSTLARITGLTVDNSVTTNATTTNSFIANLTADNAVINNINFGSASSTNSTSTNGFIANLTMNNGTSTNFFTQNLSVGNTNVSGNQTINGTFTVLGTTTLGAATTIVGNILLGTSTSNFITVNGLFNSHLVPAQNITYDLGSPSFYYRTLYVDTITANTVSAVSSTINGTTNSSFSINADNVSADAEDSTLVFFRGLVTPNAVIRWNSISKRLEANMSINVMNETPVTGSTTFSVQGGAGQGTTPLFKLLDNSENTLSYFDQNGSLGIGTSTITSGAKVDVWGNLNVGTSSTPTLFANTATGNVGIGTSTPGSTLTVAGTGLFTSNLSTLGTLGVSGQTTLTTASSTAFTATTLFSTTGTIANLINTNATSSNLFASLGTLGALTVTGQTVLSNASTTNLTVSGNLYSTNQITTTETVTNSSTTNQTTSGNTYFSGLTAGSIPFIGGGGLLSQNNANLFWDNTNARLGVGTTTPGALLTVSSSTATGTTGLFSIATSSNPLLSVLANGIIQLKTGRVNNGVQFIGGVGGSLEFTNSASGVFSAQGNGLGQVTWNGTEVDLGNNFGVAGRFNCVSGSCRTSFNSTNFPVATAQNFFKSNADGNIGMIIAQNSVSQTGDLFQLTDSAGTSVLSTFSASGSLGIGSTTPGSKLSITGTSGATTPLFTVASSTNSVIFNVLANGNVGIGTTTPDQKLVVEGNNPAIAINNTGSGSGNFPIFILRHAGADKSYLYWDNANSFTKFSSAGALRFDTNGLGNTNMTLLANGNLGIGTTTPSTKLSVAGNGLFDGVVTASNFVATSTAPSTFTNATITNASTTNTTGTGLTFTNGLFLNSLASNGTLNITGQTVLANASTTNLSISGNLYAPNFLGTTGSFSTLSATNASTTNFTNSNNSYFSALTAGSIPFIGGGGLLSQNNANLFWDNTNARLGVGTTTPIAKLSVSDATNYGNVTADQTKFGSYYLYSPQAVITGTSTAPAGTYIGVNSDLNGSNISLTSSSNFIGTNLSSIKGSVSGSPVVNLNLNANTGLGFVSTAAIEGNANVTPVYISGDQLFFNSYGGQFTNTSGNGVSTTPTSNIYGINASSNSNLARGSHYGGNFIAAGTASSNYGVRVASVSGAGSNYGLMIDTVAASSTNYALYSGALAQSYFAGNVGIGTLSPTGKFSIITSPSGMIDAPAMDILSTHAIGSVTTSGVRTFTMASSTYNPSATLSNSSVSGTNVIIANGNTQNINLNNFTLSDVTGVGARNALTVNGYTATLTGSPVINDTNPDGLGQVITVAGFSGNVSVTPAVTSLVNIGNFNSIAGEFNNTSSDGGSNLSSLAYGIKVSNTATLATANASDLYGGFFNVSGTATNAYGLKVNVIGSTNNHGMLISSVSGGASNYGLRIDTVAASSTNYALYSGALAQSYFSGNLGIGTTSPTEKLSVAGNGLFDGVVTASNFFATSTTPSTFINASTTNLTVSGNLYSTNQITTTETVTNSSTTNQTTSGNSYFSALTSGSIPFIGAGGLLSQNNSNLFWDNTNARLGVGTSTPVNALTVVGNGLLTGSLTVGNGSTNAIVDINGLSSNSALLRFLRSGTEAGRITFANSADMTFQLGSSPAEMMRITSAGNIGIGSTTPGSKLSVTGASGSIAPLFTVASSTNSVLFNVLANGNVGIGTTTPLAALHVTTQVADIAYFNSSISPLGRLFIAARGGPNGEIEIGNHDGAYRLLDVQGSILTFGVSGTEKMRIDASGNIGIGSTTPTAKFTVSGDNGAVSSDSLVVFGDNLNSVTGATTAKLTIGNIDGNSELLIGQDGTHNLVNAWIYNATAASGYGLIAGYGGNNNIVLQRDGGNVGIGATTTPSARLSIKGIGTTTGINFQTTNSSNVPLFSILDNGNVGIGTSSPIANLQIGNTTSASTASPVTLSLGGTFSSVAGANLKLKLFDSGANVYGLGVSANSLDVSSAAALNFYTNASTTPSMTVAATGNVGVGTGAPVSTLNVNQLAGTTKGISITGDETFASGNGSITSGVRIALGVSRANNRQLWLGDIAAYGSSTAGLFRYNTGQTGWGGFDVVSGDGSSRFLTVAGSDTSNVGIGYNGSPVDPTLYTGKLNVFSYNDSAASTTLNLRHFGTASGNYLDIKNSAGTLLATFTNAGNMGIGVTSPTSLLSIASTTASGATGLFSVASSSSIFNILANGNVGIGTTTSIQKLDVNSSTFLANSVNGAYVTSDSAVTNSAYLASNAYYNGSSWQKPFALKSAIFGSAGSGASKGFYIYGSESTTAGTISDFEERFKVLTTGNVIMGVGAGGGNVGVGTTTPSTKLSVAGNGLFDGVVTASNFVATSTTPSTFINASTTNHTNSGNNYFSALTSGSIPFIGAGGLLSQNNANLFWDNTNGRLGVGTTTPGSLLTVSSSTATGTTDLFSVSTSSPIFNILANGNIGIGTTTPTDKLFVSGTFSAGTSTLNNLIVTNTSTSTFAGAVQITKSTVGPTTVLTLKNGQFNVGDTSDILFSHGNLQAFSKISSSLPGSNQTHLAFYTSSNTNSLVEAMRIDGNGKVGIGTSSPANLLHISGNGDSRVMSETTGADTVGTAGFVMKGGGTNAQWQIFTNRSDLAGAADNFAIRKNAGTTGVKLVIQDNGNVGIGTTTPIYSLDVVGNIRTAGAASGFIMNNRATNQTSAQWYSPTAGETRLFDHVAGLDRFTINSSGSVGIGTTTPGNTLSVEGSGNVARFGTSANAFSFIQVDSNNATIKNVFGTDISGTPTGFLGTLTNHDLILRTNNTEKVRITTGGNVGIGVSPALARLQVNDGGGTAASEILSLQTGYAANSAQKALTWRDGVNITGQIDTRYDGTSIDMVFGHLYNSGYNTTDRMVIKGTGNVGIGTLAPFSRLHVAQDVTQYSTSGTFAQLEVTGGTNINQRLAIGYNTSTNVGFIQAIINGVSFQPLALQPLGGNVGIATSTPGQALAVVGTIQQSAAKSCALSSNASGDIICTSDERLKDIAGIYNGGIGQLLSINPIRFNYKNESYQHVGFSAQNIASVLPEGAPIQSNGFYGLDSNAVLALTLNSVKDIAHRIDFSNAPNSASLIIDNLGGIMAKNFMTDTTSSVAERFPAEEAVDVGTVVAFGDSSYSFNDIHASSTDTYSMSGVRKARTQGEAIGVVTSNAGLITGTSSNGGVPVVFSGRTVVQVTNEYGPIQKGDYLTLSTTTPGKATKMSGEGQSLGVAVSADNGSGRILVVLNTGYQKVDTNSRAISTSGMLTTGNLDLNANGVAILNIKSLASANGTWSINEDGRIIAKILCLEDVCIDKTQLTNLLNNSGQGGAPASIQNSTSTPSGDVYANDVNQGTLYSSSTPSGTHSGMVAGTSTEAMPAIDTAPIVSEPASGGVSVAPTDGAVTP